LFHVSAGERAVKFLLAKGRGRALAWALAVVALVIANEQLVEHFARQRTLEHEKSHVLNRLAALRAGLEGVVNANFSLVHGLTAVIAANPAISQAGFAAIARHLVQEPHALRNIGGAPDMVISLMYPLKGNEAALGLDYRVHPTQRAAALRARESGQAVVAGPLTLEQGGVGVILREPVFVDPVRPGDPPGFWGLVSAVMDVDVLFRQAGLADPALDIELALRGTDGTGAAGPVFHGQRAIYDKQPVTLEVTLPGGNWQMAAIPKGGWGWHDAGVGLVRAMGLLAALLAGAMAYRLVRSNQALVESSAKLQESQGMFERFMANLPVGAFIRDAEANRTLFQNRWMQDHLAQDGGDVPAADSPQAPVWSGANHERRVLAEEQAHVQEICAGPGGRPIHCDTHAFLIPRAGGRPLVGGIIRDITEQKAAQEHIQRLNRLYRVLSGINEAIVRLREPQALFDEACRIAVDKGGFRMAWLGMTDPDQQAVRPLAHAGVADHYLEDLHISLADDERGRGPTGAALRRGEHVVCNDIASDPRMAPWREKALALGFRSSAAFPIRIGGTVRGAFNLYADRPGYFDEDELGLLDELAQDISFALEFMEANEARDALNRQLVDLLESMSDGFVSLTRDWRYQYVNRKAGEMFGREASSLIGKHIWTEFPEGVGQPFHRAYERVMKDRVVAYLEEYYAPWDQWFENRVYPTQGGIAIFFSNITERKTREAELKRLQTTLAALVEGATDVIFVKDREGRYVIANQAMADLLGCGVADIIGHQDGDLFAAELATRFHADDERVRAGGRVESFEESVVSAGGRLDYLTTKGPLVIDGEVEGVFGIARDITARKRGEAALFESEARLRLFIDHAPAALAMLDRQLRYLAVSQRWLKDYQLEGQVLLGRSHYDVFPQLPESWREVHRRCLGGEVVRADEERFVRADGSVRWLRWEVRPWLLADGGVGGIVIFTEDITERRQAQEALQQSQARLLEAQQLARLGNWELDLETDTLTWSDEIFRIFEIDKARFPATYEAFLDAVHPEDREAVDSAYRQSVESGEPYDITHRLLLPGGHIKFVHEIGRTFVDDAGRPVRSAGTVQDVTERKLAEARARQNEILLDSVFQALPDLFFLMDPDGTIRDYRSRRSADLYVPPEAFLNRRMQDVLPAELGALFQAKLNEVSAHGVVATYEYDLPVAGGARRFEARLTRLPDTPQVVAVVRDISRGHHDRMELAASEARYRQLFEHSPAPMLVYEKGSLRLLAVNEAFTRHYGYGREEALSLQLTDLYPPDERARMTQVATKLRGLAYVGEWHHRRKDGSLITIEVRSHDLEYEGREARIVAATDITERKRAEQALQESEERLRLALQSANQGTYDLDLLSGEAAVSPEYARMLGHDPATFHESHTAWLARLHPDDHDRVLGVFTDYLAGKIPEYRVEFRQRTQDGQWKSILSVGRIQAWDEEGRPLRMLGTHTDITAMRQAEQEIRRLNVELEKRVLERTAELAAVNKELETFSYSVSHDLKAPLRGIDGYSRLLLEDYENRLDEEGRLFLHNIRRGVEQMGQLIEDLLAYSRMERRSLHSHPLDLSLQVASALNERLAELQARGVEVEVGVHGLMVHADPEGLAMVLRNLIDNALKFTRDRHPPRLAIEAQVRGKSIIIALADNGIGFDMQFHERIFEIFQRLQRAEDYPGTGVGLAIVRKTMQRMGGRVWAESIAGQGATFYLELPR
jgi:PAS domain S-box-containing protein